MTVDYEATARALYGSPAPAAPAPAAAPAAPAPAPAPEADKPSAADVLYGQPKPTTDEDGSPSGHTPAHLPALRDIERAGVDRLGLPQEQAFAAANEWGTKFSEYGVQAGDANDLVQIGVGAMANGVDDATAKSWASDAQAALRQDYGNGADAALGLARQLVAKDQKLAAFLDRTGLGSHPKVVRTIAARARALRAAGKL